jgi:hypothetical protein
MSGKYAAKFNDASLYWMVVDRDGWEFDGRLTSEEEAKALANRRNAGDVLGDWDDPVCVCGVHRSEHALCGCSDGFQTAADWAAEQVRFAQEWEEER